jgi:hypothetical protein
VVGRTSMNQATGLYETQPNRWLRHSEFLIAWSHHPAANLHPKAVDLIPTVNKTRTDGLVWHLHGDRVWLVPPATARIADTLNKEILTLLNAEQPNG